MTNYISTRKAKGDSNIINYYIFLIYIIECIILNKINSSIPLTQWQTVVPGAPWTCLHLPEACKQKTFANISMEVKYTVKLYHKAFQIHTGLSQIIHATRVFIYNSTVVACF